MSIHPRFVLPQPQPLLILKGAPEEKAAFPPTTIPSKRLIAHAPNCDCARKRSCLDSQDDGATDGELSKAETETRTRSQASERVGLAAQPSIPALGGSLQTGWQVQWWCGVAYRLATTTYRRNERSHIWYVQVQEG